MRPDDAADVQQLDPPPQAAPAVEPASPGQSNGGATGDVQPAAACASTERPVGPPSTDLDGRLAVIEAALADVARRLAAETARAAARERVIDRQHAEIERLRAAERVGQLRPVVTDLCRLRNDLMRQAAKVPAEVTRSQVANLLGSFAASVEETLERCGVAVLDQEVGAAFVPGRQQVAAVVETGDPEQDGTVAEVVQQGYAEIDGGKIVAPARITLYRYLTKEKTDG